MNPCWIVETSVTTTYCYDRRGNVIEKKQTQGATIDAVAYSFTLAGRVIAETRPVGAIVRYAYDSLGQVSGVWVTPMGGAEQVVASKVTWLPFGPLQAYTLGNGQSVLRMYDNNYRVTDIVSQAIELHFKLDAMGNITGVTEKKGAAATYVYDPLYRLTAVKDATGAAVENYAYNLTGARISKAASGTSTGTYGYKTGTHLLTSIGTTSRMYDANGNTTGNAAAGMTFGYGYGGRNRMTVAQLAGTTVGSYAYNVVNERVAKTVGPTTTRFLYNEHSQLISELSGAAARDYIAVAGIPLAVADGSTLGFIAADGLGSPRVVTSLTGAVVWAWGYQGDPFGEQKPTSNGYSLNLRYPGHYFDAETNTNYNVNRTYDPGTGRYLQSDPAGFGGGVSTYAAVSNSPLTRIDPDGLRDIFVGGFGDSSSRIVQSYYATYHQTHPDSAYYQWTQQSEIEKDIKSTRAGDPVHLIGHSYGGDTAAAAAINTCGRVNLLITIDPVSRFHYRGMQNIANSVNNWVDVDVQGGSAFQSSNFIAGIGGAWNSAPSGIANSYIEDGLVNHEDFNQMMNASGPMVMSPAQMLSRSQQ